MRNHAIVTLSLAMVFVFLFAFSSTSGEKKLTRKQVPAAVLTAFEKAYPSATIKGYSKEDEKGKVYFEIESMDGETGRDVLYNPDGTVAEVEQSMAAGDLPAAVKSAVSKEYPKGTISKAEKTTRGNDVSYEVHLMIGKSKHEVVLDANGKVIKHEKESEEENEKSEKD